MTDIAIITGESVCMDWLRRILEEEMPMARLTIYEDIPRDKECILKKDLMLIDLNRDNELLHSYLGEEVKIIACTWDKNKEVMLPYLKLGLHGYLFLEIEVDEIIQAVKRVLAGERYIHPYFSEMLLDEYVRKSNNIIERPSGLLSKREWNVLEKMAKGYQNEAIGRSLFISEKTVKNHVSAILKKLQVSDRTNAVLTAIKNDWVKI